MILLKDILVYGIGVIKYTSYDKDWVGRKDAVSYWYSIGVRRVRVC